MKEFTRIAWASARTQSVWETRIARIEHAFRQVEVDSVRIGFRSAALVYRLSDLNLKGLKTHLVTPVRSVVVQQEAKHGPHFVRMYKRNNDVALGAMLGFPECCQFFFDEVWNLERKRDTTLSMAEGPGGPAACNMFARTLGIRLVPHLPCSFACTETERFAGVLEILWPREEWMWANEILSWPVKYSSLHGVAEITFPVFKIVTDTDYVYPAHVLERHGTSYPDEAPTGLTFPFVRPHFTPIEGLRKGIVNKLLWTDNGFPSKALMDAAHNMVVEALRTHSPRGDILDLGAGNGQLMRRIEAIYEGGSVGGVEIDPKKAAKHPHILQGDLCHVEDLVTRSFDTIIVSERRFEEIPTLEEWVRRHCRQALIYSYDKPQSVRILQGELTNASA